MAAKLNSWDFLSVGWLTLLWGWIFSTAAMLCGTLFKALQEHYMLTFKG